MIDPTEGLINDTDVNAIVDPIVSAFKMLSENTLQNDHALFELIQALIAKVNNQQIQIDLLMELHHIAENEPR